jgi:hypothetical protein
MAKRKTSKAMKAPAGPARGAGRLLAAAVAQSAPIATTLPGNPTLAADTSWVHLAPFQCTLDFSNQPAANFQNFVNSFLGAIVSYTEDDGAAQPTVTFQQNWVLTQSSITSPQVLMTFLAVCPHDHNHFTHPPQFAMPQGTGRIIVITMNLVGNAPAQFNSPHPGIKTNETT